jgi:hypothetical protein
MGGPLPSPNSPHGAGLGEKPSATHNARILLQGGAGTYYGH